MTEQVQNFSADQSQAASISSNVSTSAPVQPEKTFTQADLDRVAGKIRDDAYQKGVRDTLSKVQQPSAEPTYQSPAPAIQQVPQHVQHVGGIPQLTDEQLRTKIIEEQQKLEQFKSYQGLVNSFVSKLEAAKSKYEDFDTVAKDLNLPQIPVIWQAAEKFDNAADIVYHLGKNPTKLSQLLTVAYSPELVRRGMQEISDSLKQNEAASEQKQPNPPLSRQKPSNIGMGNGGKNGLTVQDYKKIYRV